MKKTYKIDVAEHRVDVPDLPAALEGLRIVQFSDLHGPKSIAFIRQVNGLLRQAAGDLLVCTGDVLDSPHWLSAAWRQLPVLLEGLKPALGFYVCLGNHDRARIIPVLQALGARVLINRWETVSVNGAVLNIGGVYSRFLRDQAAAQQRVARAMPPQGTTILLSHLPSAIWTFTSPRVSLVLAGHTHGGQWRFPVLGCVWAHDDIPTHMAYGLSKVGPTWLHVTAGLGESGPFPVRFRCRPEIAILTLRRACAHGC